MKRVTAYLFMMAGTAFAVGALMGDWQVALLAIIAAVCFVVGLAGVDVDGTNT